MQMHTLTQNSGVSLDKEFQKNMSKQHRKNGSIDQGKYKKRASERKCTDREYHFHDNADVLHKDF